MTRQTPPGQAAVLEAVRELAAAGERASDLTVARKLGVSRQVAAKQLRALEKKGLVRDRPRVVRSGQWEVT